MPRAAPRLSLTLWLVLLCFVAAPGQAGDRFIAGMEDVPLMPGLSQLIDGEVVFDAPSGRIVEVYAEGAVARDAVRAFYARTLPQLGWRASGADSYAREGETFRLEFPDRRRGAGPERLIVRFFLSPG